MKWQFLFSHMFVIFWKNYFFTLFQNNSFQSNTRVTFSEQLSSEQLLFLRRSFSEQSIFLSLYFSELLLQSETSTEQPHLENRKFFSAVTFRNSYLQKISTEELLSRRRFFCTTTTFSKKRDFGKSYFFRKAIFCITYFFWRATFYSSYIFRRATFLQHTISEELLFLSYTFFHSYTSY